MKEINIYALNINPCGEKDTDSVRKSEIVKSIWNGYKDKNGTLCKKGEVKLFSFCPKIGEGYTAFVELFVEKKAIKPCILIFKSLTDLSNIPKTACVRLKNMLNQEGICGIYFSDYSVVHDASSYNEKLANAFGVSNVLSSKNNRKSHYPKEVRDVVLKLRNQDEPVRYSDIANITGIPVSTLRSLKHYEDGENCGVVGRKLNSSETCLLFEAMREGEQRINNSVEIFEETYIEKKKQEI